MDSIAAIAGKMVVLIVILIISFAGNVLVIIVVHRSRRNQWTTNYFVLSLAVVNLVTPTAYVSMSLDWVYRGHWVFGNIGCKIWAFLQHFNAFISVGTLCCISFDRYYLTAYPLTFKLSKSQTNKLILIIRLLAAAISSPLFHFYDSGSDKPASCLPLASKEWTAYFLCLALLFFLPHVATYVMYVKVYLCIRARNSKSAVLNYRFARKVPRTKVKVAKLLVAQVVVYTFLWSPFFVYQIISSVSNPARENMAANTATWYIAYASTAASPVVYAIFSGDFRRGCKQILMKYDVSSAYRLPAQLERKNRVGIIIAPDFNSGPSERRYSVKRESTEQVQGMTFEQPKLAWA